MLLACAHRTSGMLTYLRLKLVRWQSRSEFRRADFAPTGNACAKRGRTIGSWPSDHLRRARRRGHRREPCVLPVLPALLSAGRNRRAAPAAGIVLGLAVRSRSPSRCSRRSSAASGLATRRCATSRSSCCSCSASRSRCRRWRARIEAPLSRIARFGPKDGGDGFASGLAVGAALGFVYTPCAGPILAAVISVGATTGTTLRTVPRRTRLRARVRDRPAHRSLAGGRRLLPRTATRAASARRRAGAHRGRDDRRSSTSAPRRRSPSMRPTRTWPPGSRTPRRSTGGSTASARRRSSPSATTRPAVDAAGPRHRARLHRDPALVQLAAPVPGGAARAGRAGRLLDLHLHQLHPHAAVPEGVGRALPTGGADDRRRAFAGVLVREDAGNVQRAIASFGIRYPVVQDNDLATWSAWGNQYWPAEYLIDARGRSATCTSARANTTRASRRSGRCWRSATGRARRDGQATRPVHDLPATTPETYIGSARAERWLPGKPRDGTNTYATPSSLPVSHFALGGTGA